MKEERKEKKTEGGGGRGEEKIDERVKGIGRRNVVGGREDVD